MPENVTDDAEIEFAEEASFKKYPENLRPVRFHDNEHNRDFAFLTNDFSLPSLKVADLHRNRWQVELFFKWLRQHLKIKKFRVWGRDGERRPDPDECRDHNLQTCGGRTQGTETGALDMRASSNTERITYGQDSHANFSRNRS